MSNESEKVKQTMLDGAMLLHIALVEKMADGQIPTLKTFQAAYMETAHIAAMAHQQNDRIAVAMVTEAHKLIVEIETGVSEKTVVN